MKLYKLFLIISFTLFSVTNIFGQAAVDIPLILTDGTFNIPRAVGLDLTATNCIDPHLGEGEFVFPPFPIFECGFNLAPYGCGSQYTGLDYRPPGNPPAFPFTGLVNHTLWYQVSPGLPIDITYNLPFGVMMTITDQIGGGFLNIGPFTGQGTATIPGSYTLIFSQALLKMEYDNIIPIELISFTDSILQNEKAVHLDWTTATETNNSGFEIERKALSFGEGLGEAWEAIGFVPGFGTTTEPKSYSYIDENVKTGTYKYRLKQIDFDGTFTFSNEIEVAVDFTPKEFVLYQNYPNPFNPNTKIKYEIPASLNPSKGGTLRNITLKVYDLLGKEVAVLVNQKQEPGVYEIDFDAGSLSSGIYLYQLNAEGFVQTKKMILAK